jgi:hypothetical protein
MSELGTITGLLTALAFWGFMAAMLWPRNSRIGRWLDG